MGRINIENLFDINEEREAYIEAKVIITFFESKDMDEALSKLINEFTDRELAYATYLIGKMHALFTINPLKQVHLMEGFIRIYNDYKQHGFNYVYQKFLEYHGFLKGRENVKNS